MKRSISIATTACFTFLLLATSIWSVPATPTAPAQACSPRNLRVGIVIPEWVFMQPVPDPAAETETKKRFNDAGFTVVESGPVDVMISGQALAEILRREGQLISCRSRVEVKAVRTADGTIVDAGDQEATARDISGQIGAKAALRDAGGLLADQLIAHIARSYGLCPRPRVIPRVSTAVVTFTAPRLPSDIDFSRILADPLIASGTVEVVASGQDLFTILSNAHAGKTRLPDTLLIGAVEEATIISLYRIGPFSFNIVTLRMSVRLMDTETGVYLPVVSRREKVTQGFDIVGSIGEITPLNFERTLLGQVFKELLQQIAPESAEAATYVLPHATYTDLITFRNADRRSCRIVNPSFTIQGNLAFPMPDMQSVSVRDGANSRIILSNGDSYTGRLLDPAITLECFSTGAVTIPIREVATVVCAIK